MQFIKLIAIQDITSYSVHNKESNHADSIQILRYHSQPYMYMQHLAGSCIATGNYSPSICQFLDLKRLATLTVAWHGHKPLYMHMLLFCMHVRLQYICSGGSRIFVRRFLFRSAPKFLKPRPFSVKTTPIFLCLYRSQKNLRVCSYSKSTFADGWMLIIYKSQSK